MVEQILGILVNYLALAIVGVVFAIVGLLAQRLKAYIEVKIGSDKFATLQNFADICVRFLQQSPAYEGWENGEKKEFAINWLMNKAKTNKIPLDLDLADKLIEAVYQGVKTEVFDIEAAG